MNENKTNQQKFKRMFKGIRKTSTSSGNDSTTDEAKTIVNGQDCFPERSTSMEQAIATTKNQTGIQAHHDNSTEAVQAGQMAKNQQEIINKHLQNKTSSNQMFKVDNHTFNKFKTSGSQSQAEIEAQENHQTIQNSIDAKAKAKTKKGQLIMDTLLNLLKIDLGITHNLRDAFFIQLLHGQHAGNRTQGNHA